MCPAASVLVSHNFMTIIVVVWAIMMPWNSDQMTVIPMYIKNQELNLIQKNMCPNKFFIVLRMVPRCQ